MPNPLESFVSWISDCFKIVPDIDLNGLDLDEDLISESLNAPYGEVVELNRFARDVSAFQEECTAAKQVVELTEKQKQLKACEGKLSALEQQARETAIVVEEKSLEGELAGNKNRLELVEKTLSALKLDVQTSVRAVGEEIEVFNTNCEKYGKYIADPLDHYVKLGNACDDQDILEVLDLREKIGAVVVEAKSQAPAEAGVTKTIFDDYNQRVSELDELFNKKLKTLVGDKTRDIRSAVSLRTIQAELDPAIENPNVTLFQLNKKILSYRDIIAARMKYVGKINSKFFDGDIDKLNKYLDSLGGKIEAKKQYICQQEELKGSPLTALIKKHIAVTMKSWESMDTADLEIAVGLAEDGLQRARDVRSALPDGELGKACDALDLILKKVRLKLAAVEKERKKAQDAETMSNRPKVLSDLNIDEPLDEAHREALNKWLGTVADPDEGTRKELISAIRLLPKGENQLREEIFKKAFNNCKLETFVGETRAPLDPNILDKVVDVIAGLPKEHLPDSWIMEQTVGMATSGGAWDNGTAQLKVGLDDVPGFDQPNLWAGDDDVSTGTKYVDAAIRHELGHKVYEQGGDGLTNKPEGGQWRSHPSIDAVVAELKPILAQYAGLLAQTLKLSDPLDVAVLSRSLAAVAELGASKPYFIDDLITKKVLLEEHRDRCPDHFIFDALDMGTTGSTEFIKKAPVDCGGRTYIKGGTGWCSFAYAAYANRVSWYQFAAPSEWFAEFYASANNGNESVRKKTKAKNPAAYKWFGDNRKLVFDTPAP